MYGIEKVYHEREEAFRAINKRNLKQIGLVSFLHDEERFQWNKEWFDEMIEAPFEYITVKIPKDYEEILGKTYGDWKKPVKGAAMHQGIDFNCDISYTDYLVEKYGYSKFD